MCLKNYPSATTFPIKSGFLEEFNICDLWQLITLFSTCIPEKVCRNELSTTLYSACVPKSTFSGCWIQVITAKKLWIVCQNILCIIRCHKSLLFSVKNYPSKCKTGKYQTALSQYFPLITLSIPFSDFQQIWYVTIKILTYSNNHTRIYSLKLIAAISIEITPL